MNSLTLFLLAAVAVACVSAWGHEEHYAAIPYKYEYGVKDPHTKDHKDAWEHSDGHNVKGGYKFDEADGTHRVVEYVSDGKGTNTIVKRVGHASHPDHYGHEHGHGYGHGYGHHGSASSYANYNQYPHGHHY